MYSKKSHRPTVRSSLPNSLLKGRLLVESDSPLYKCVSPSDKKLKSSTIAKDDRAWGKLERRSRSNGLSDAAKPTSVRSKSNGPLDTPKLTPSLYITTYRETIHFSEDDPEYHRNSSRPPLTLNGTTPTSSLKHLTNGSSFRRPSPSPSRRSTPLSLKTDPPPALRRSSSLRRSLPRHLPSSSRSSSTLPPYSRSSGFYSDFLDDDQISLRSSTLGSVASTWSGSGYEALKTLAPGYSGRSGIPWYLSDLGIDARRHHHHAASELLQDEMRHDFPGMVGTIGNLDKSVQYYHLLEEQLRQYREALEDMRNRIDGLDGITKFKAVNYEGSFKHVHPRYLGDEIEPTTEALNAKIAAIEREERQARREREKLMKAKLEEERMKELEEEERKWLEEEEEEERLWQLEEAKRIEEAMARVEQERQRQEEEIQQQEAELKRKTEERIQEEKRRVEERRTQEEKRVRKEEEMKRVEEQKEKEERKRKEEERKRKEEEDRIREEEERKKKEEEERIRKEEDRKKKQEEERRKKQEEDRRKKEEEKRTRKEEERRKKEEEERKKREQEERIRKAEEKKKEQEDRMRKEEEDRIRKEKERKKKEDEERRRNEEEERRRKEEEERIRKEVERKKKEDEERKRKMEEERIRKEEERRKKEEEERRRKEEEDRIKKEEERKKKEDEERKRKMEEERIRKEEERRKKEEEERRRKEEEDRIKKEERKKKEDEERKRKMEEERIRKEEERRKKEEEERRRKEEEDRIRKEERKKKEDEEKKKKEEEEIIRKEEERERKAEENRMRREEEIRRKEEEERLRKEEEIRKVEENRKRKEEERLRKQEEEGKKKEEGEKKRKEEEEMRKIRDVVRQNMQKTADEEIKSLGKQVRKTLCRSKNAGKTQHERGAFCCSGFGDYDHRYCMLIPVCSTLWEEIDLELTLKKMHENAAEVAALKKLMVDGGNFDHFTDEYDTDDELDGNENWKLSKRTKPGKFGVETSNPKKERIREETRTVIAGVLNPQTGKQVSIEEAVDLGLVDNSKGLYHNPKTGKTVSITQAIADGHITTEKVTVEKMEVKTRSIGLMTIQAQVDKQRYRIVSVKDAETEESYDLIQARRLGLIDLKTKEYVYPNSTERISLDEAIQNGLILIEFEEVMDNNNNNETVEGLDEIDTLNYGIDYVVDFQKKSKAPFRQAIQRGLVDIESGVFFNNLTKEQVPLIDAISKGFLKGETVRDIKNLNVKKRNEVLINAKGKIKKNYLNPLSVIVAFRNAAQYGMGDGGALNYSTTMTDEGVVEKIVSSEITATDAAGLRTVGRTEMGVAQGVETETVEAEQIVTCDIEVETITLVRSVLDPVFNVRISIHDAVDFGIIDYSLGVYRNPKTGESSSIPEAMQDGRIQVEMVRVKRRDEHTRAIGIITIKSVIEKLHYNIAKVYDTTTGRCFDMMQARSRGLLDLKKNQYISTKTGERISLDKAIELELVTVNFDSDNTEPEIIKKTYAINYVVDQLKKIKVPFYEAVRKGLVNAETGNYMNNKTGEVVYVGDAIRKGFLKGREVKGKIGLDIDAENKDVTRRIGKIRSDVVRSMAVLAAFKNATRPK